MKTIILFSCMFAFICNITFAQTKGRLFKASSWGNTKKYGWSASRDNPTYEKVEILQTDKYFKVTFGTKVTKYDIVSSKKFSDVLMGYNVTSNGKSYVINVANTLDSPAAALNDGTYTLNIEDEWMVDNIRDIIILDNAKTSPAAIHINNNRESDYARMVKNYHAIYDYVYVEEAFPFRRLVVGENKAAIKAPGEEAALYLCDIKRDTLLILQRYDSLLLLKFQIMDEGKILRCFYSADKSIEILNKAFIKTDE